MHFAVAAKFLSLYILLDIHVSVNLASFITKWWWAMIFGIFILIFDWVHSTRMLFSIESKMTIWRLPQCYGERYARTPTTAAALGWAVASFDRDWYERYRMLRHASTAKYYARKPGSNSTGLKRMPLLSLNRYCQEGRYSLYNIGDAAIW